MSRALLAVADFPSSTGYAWSFIRTLHLSVGEEAVRRGMSAYIAYPVIDELPAAVRDSPVEAVELDVRRDTAATLRFVRRHHVHTVWISDWTTWDPRYSLWRAVGARRVVMHDHTSGARSLPRGARRLLKRLRRIVPGSSADVAIAVSDYVARRIIAVDLFPADRIVTVHNGVDPPDEDEGDARRRLRDELGVAPDRLVVACACRAAESKGVHHLLRAFDGLLSEWSEGPPPVLAYFGDGPALDAWRSLASRLDQSAAITLAGYHPDAAGLVGGADVAVVPSTWEEAFGLAALEPAARGVPVVASRVGGLPEVVQDGETGILVAPGDEEALAAALRGLLADPAERARMGRNARLRARQHFSLERQRSRLADAVLGR